LNKILHCFDVALCLFYSGQISVAYLGKLQITGIHAFVNRLTRMAWWPFTEAAAAGKQAKEVLK
jgi:hypothetical protein